MIDQREDLEKFQIYRLEFSGGIATTLLWREGRRPRSPLQHGGQRSPQPLSTLALVSIGPTVVEMMGKLCRGPGL